MDTIYLTCYVEIATAELRVVLAPQRTQRTGGLDIDRPSGYSPPTGRKLPCDLILASIRRLTLLTGIMHLFVFFIADILVKGTGQKLALRSWTTKEYHA